jgi:hypothetical protein
LLDRAVDLLRVEDIDVAALPEWQRRSLEAA